MPQAYPSTAFSAMLRPAESAAARPQEQKLSAPDAPRAVFVDPTGRRHRLVARTCWILGGLGVAYVALVVVSLLLPPGLTRLSVPGLGPVLPGPAAALLGAAEADGEVQAPDVLLAPSPSPRGPGASPAPSAAVASPVSSPRPTASPPPGPAPRPATAPQSSPAPASPPGAAPATPPGQQPSAGPSRASAAPATPPGQGSPRPRPTPSRGPR